MCHRGGRHACFASSPCTPDKQRTLGGLPKFLLPVVFLFCPRAYLCSPYFVGTRRYRSSVCHRSRCWMGKGGVFRVEGRLSVVRLRVSGMESIRIFSQHDMTHESTRRTPSHTTQPIPILTAHYHISTPKFPSHTVGVPPAGSFVRFKLSLSRSYISPDLTTISVSFV